MRGTLPSFHWDLGRKNQQLLTPSPSTTILDTPQGRILGFPLTSRKDACPSLTPPRVATCLCLGDPSPMTLRCLETSGNGAEGTRSQWGTAGSAEEPSPEAARLAKALRELSQSGREPNGRVREGAPPRRRGWGRCGQRARLGSGASMGSKEWGGKHVPSLPVLASG